MTKLSIQQIRGIKDLIQDTVDAGVKETARVHQAIARQPYALLEKLNLITVPVRAVERAQEAITAGIYQSIRAVNQIAGGLATQVIDRLEARRDNPENP